MELHGYSIDQSDVEDWINTDATHDELEEIKELIEKELKISNGYDGVLVEVPNLLAEQELNEFLEFYRKKHFITET
jgi:hypothetical protein